MNPARTATLADSFLADFESSGDDDVDAKDDDDDKDFEDEKKIV